MQHLYGQYYASTYGQGVYGGSTYNNATTTSSNSNTASSTGTVSTSGSTAGTTGKGNLLANTGFDIVLAVSLAAAVTASAIVVRVWKRSAKTEA